METTRFLSLTCVRLKNSALELLVTQSVGPRIIRLSLMDSENILAELPDLAIDCPGASEKMNFWGGHRLWHAPQVPSRTHLPDNHPVKIEELADGLEVVQQTELQTGIQKSMQITLPDDTATVVVDHTLTNEGLWPIETAPWAITQLKPGGVAILPQHTQNVDADGVWPNRSLAFWPFTDINSPHIHWGNRFIFVEATMRTGMMKFGFPNPAGWLAYYRDQTLFVKQAPYHAQASYFDMGSSSHFFCQPEFLELETLGPRSTLAPGESATHRETWSLYSGVALETTESSAEAIVEELNL
jgi:hypothetical protein